PDAISIFHWTFQQHHAGGKPRRWCDEDGVWHKVDERDTEYTGRKLTLTEAALENLPVSPGPLTQYEVVDVDGQPMSDLPFAAVAAMVREANVAQQYLDAVGRFESSVNLDAIAFGLGHGMMLNLLHAMALPASCLSTHAQTSILHALANPGAPTRIAVHHLRVNGASVGGGVLLFYTAGGDNDTWVLYSPGTPDNKVFRSFRGLNDLARKLKDDEALRNYMVEAIVAGERPQASRVLARGGRGGEIATVPIAGDFLVATAGAFFAQWRNESRHVSNTTSFRDQLTIADNVKGVADVLDVVLPLSGLVGGGLDMNGAIECFLAEEKGCYGKLAAAGLAVALDALPMAAEPFRTPLKAMGRAVRRHFATVVRGANGKPMVRFALPADTSSRLPDSDIAAVLHKFAVSGIDVTTMHSPSRRLFRDGTGQEYVTIGDRTYRSRTVLKPDGSGERVIVDPLDAGNTWAIRLSGEGWTVLPAARLVGGSPRRPAITWGEPRWSEGHLKGIGGTSTSRRIAVDIDGYRTDILFDLAVCKWRTADGSAMRPGAYVEYNELTRNWQYSVPEPGRGGVPALPPRRASDEQRLDALNQFGISRAPLPWPRPVEGARTPIPKVINQVWLGDAQALKTRRTLDRSGDLLIDTIEANGRLAKEGGYESRLYVLLDDESPAAVKALQDALPDIKVVDLRSDPLFAEFKTTRYAEPFEFFRSPDRSRRNLSAASDILRHFIQYKEGGVYLDTDDVLLQGFGQVGLMAKADEVLTGGVMSHRALGMDAEYNTNAFASHKGNGFFIEVLDEQATRVHLNRHRLSDRPHDRGDRESYEALVAYMPIVSQSTGPGVFNDVLRRRSGGHADFADAMRDIDVIGNHPWLSNVSSLDGTFERAAAQDGFTPLSRFVLPGNSHSWRQT
ncbi:MAG: dermonecrotic toxin domain-containing protein, partial [Luteibacter jiangsuensis]